MPVRVLCSYALSDQLLMEELQKHLRFLQRQEVIEIWHERVISAGLELQVERDRALGTADIILLMISADFLASDTCYDVALRRAMERHRRGEAQVMLVLLRPCDCKGAPFSELPVMPRNARPVTSWADQDEAWFDVAQGIRRAAQLLRTGQSSGAFQQQSFNLGGSAQPSSSRLLPGDVNQITGHDLFQLLAEAPPSLSRYARFREFQILVHERTQDFVGRDFIFQAVDEALQAADFPSGYLVLSGEPGIGKTALMAQWIKQRGSVHHFNIAAQNIRSSRDFLASICVQLMVRYGVGQGTLPPESTRDSGFLSQLLMEAAAQQQGCPLVIAVDALDEAEDQGLPTGANRLYLPTTLPNGVYFLVSTREEHNDRLVVDRRKVIHLRDNDPRNLHDVRSYIINILHSNEARLASQMTRWEIDEEAFLALLVEKSEGNFMYLVHVMRDILDDKQSPEQVQDIHNLPQGLRAYYRRHWSMMRDKDLDRFERYYEPVICILATVLEPVTVAQVSAWTRLDRVRITEVIQDWREFLNEHQEELGPLAYRIYHASFQEFLRDEVGLSRFREIIIDKAFSKIKRPR